MTTQDVDDRVIYQDGDPTGGVLPDEVVLDNTVVERGRAIGC